MKRLLISLVAIAAVATFACNKSTPQKTAQQTSTQSVTPMTGAPAPQAASLAITWDLPQGWVKENPSSSMRVAQARIPGSAGDGSFVAFFFGPGGGGGVEANLQRWEGQMENPSSPVRDSFQVGPYKVTWLDIKGTLQPSMMGAGPKSAQPNSRMFAAVVEGQGGPWFFKATGPEATMAAAHDPFVAMLKSIRPSK